MRITPEDVTKEFIGRKDIFVFGSNEAGIHGAGAAYFAEQELDAKHGMGFGPTSLTFAIPTKNWGLRTLGLATIGFYVGRFIRFAERYPERIFYVTKIGCGLAGYKPEQIAPLFIDAVDIPNIYLPSEFWDIINKQ